MSPQIMASTQSHDTSHTSTTEKSDQHPPQEDTTRHVTEDQEQGIKDKNQESHQNDSPNDESPDLAKIILVSLALWFGVFLVALDQTIISNAIPSITDEFKRLSDVGWYGSGYLLTTAAFQLFYGRVYANFSIKYTFLTAVTLFELGSLICGVAPTSPALIIGRAVAGLGGSGIMSGGIIIIAHTIPLRIRPIFIASIGIIFAIASVLGPVLGGIFTTHLTWRWCFYINLPFGGVTILIILVFLKPPQRPELDSVLLVEKLKKIDIIGLAIFIPAIVCLLLALQWGGSTYSWSSGRIIALLVLFGVFSLVFLGFEYWKGADATLPLRLLSRRSIAAATWNCFCNGAAFMTFLYYIPFWHQVIRGVNAADSGIRLLPLVIGLVVTSILSGALVSKIGYYAPMMILASVIAPIGEGLLTTWNVNTSFSQWVGYQAFIGLGLGLGQQQPIIAVQTVLSKSDIPSGTSIIMLVQTLGGAIFASVGQSVLQNELLKNLNAAFPKGDFDTSTLTDAGATQIRSLVPAKYLHKVLVAYNSALTKVYTVGLCMSVLTIIGSLTIEWKSVKKGGKPEENT